MAFYLGLDLGGTNIKAGVVDVNGESLSHASIPTPLSRAPREVIDATTRVADHTGCSPSPGSRIGSSAAS